MVGFEDCGNRKITTYKIYLRIYTIYGLFGRDLFVESIWGLFV